MDADASLAAHVRGRGEAWIPPSGLIAGHLAHGASWAALAYLGSRGMVWPDPRALAWVHLVALGWLTLTALSVLLFVIPQFTDARWRGEAIARAGLAGFAVGAFGIVASFWAAALPLLWIPATLALAGLVLYAAMAAASLAPILASGPRAERAIGRAFLFVLAALLAAAALGVAMARLFAAGGGFGDRIAGVHAQLGAIGWLTLLIMGVSARTIGPITGARSPRRWAHIASGSLVAAGVLVLAASPWAGDAAAAAGLVLAAAGAIVYAVDMLALIAAATVRHRPPQAFMASAVVWLLAATGLALGADLGVGSFTPAVFLALVGWAGQAVVAHLHHVGVRLIATMARGDDDGTEPGELLTPALSWLTFGLLQGAIVLGAAGTVVGRSGELLLVAAGACGVAGWLAMSANLGAAFRRATA